MPLDISVIDDEQRLFISSMITEWNPCQERGIDVVFDMDDTGLDSCIPTRPGGIIYVYFPFRDGGVPPHERLVAVGKMGAHLYGSGHRILSHCTMGWNRSALVAGVILHELGWDGPQLVERIRERRQGALFTAEYADYLASLRRS
jgi:protein-tyrosine phosphatase